MWKDPRQGLTKKKRTRKSILPVAKSNKDARRFAIFDPGVSFFFRVCIENRYGCSTVAARQAYEKCFPANRDVNNRFFLRRVCNG